MGCGSQQLLLLVAVLFMGLQAQDDIFSKYYAECRKIAEAMTLEQRLGQTIQADMQSITQTDKEITDPNEAISLSLGSLLINANAAPTDNGNLAKIPSYLEEEKVKAAYLKATDVNWRKLTSRFDSLGVGVTTKDAKYKIKFLLATDAVHGDQHSIGNVLFPHNIGLSCGHTPANFQNVGYWTRMGVKKSGFNFVLAPTVAVSHNPQWGRYYESMGQQDFSIEKYAELFVKGVQDVSAGKINGALATAKHFIGDGATLYGCNQGNANVINFDTFFDHNLKGYSGAAKANVGAVMVSYSAINWVPNSMSSAMLLGVLRENAKFNGFTISDFDEILVASSRLMPRTFMNLTEDQAYTTMVNAGVDMFMVGSKANIERIYKFAKKLYDRNHIPESRLIEAVTRILTVKMSMGLIEKTSSDAGIEVSQGPIVQPLNTPPMSSSTNEYIDSLNAVHESLVLLKNANVLPVKNIMSGIKFVVLVGEKIHNINRLTKIQLFRNFDNIGMQCGGWSVRWQGWQGNDFWSGDQKAKANASSILDALKAIQTVNKMEIIYPEYSNLNNEVSIDSERRTFLNNLITKRKDMNARNTLILGVFGEFPYAESVGDVNIPYCKVTDNPDSGCLYDPLQNTYAPAEQPKSLKVETSKFEADVIDTIKGADKTIPLISVIIAGRPLLVNDLLTSSDAVLAAWLPGTSGGQGIVDAIVGNYLLRPKDANYKNTLSVEWPRDMDSLANFPVYGTDGYVPSLSSPLFVQGYGLATTLTTLTQE